jgi:hypothetical protein
MKQMKETKGYFNKISNDLDSALSKNAASSKSRPADIEAGLEKTRVKKKKPAQWLFFGFFCFFCFFLFFLGFLYICPEERVFRVFSVSRILLGASRL